MRTISSIAVVGLAFAFTKRVIAFATRTFGTAKLLVAFSESSFGAANLPVAFATKTFGAAKLLVAFSGRAFGAAKLCVAFATRVFGAAKLPVAFSASSFAVATDAFANAKYHPGAVESICTIKHSILVTIYPRWLFTCAYNKTTRACKACVLQATIIIAERSDLAERSAPKVRPLRETASTTDSTSG